MKKYVTHLIMGLGKGGAETMLYNVLCYKQSQNIEYKVISFGLSHYYEPKIKDLNVEIVDLDIRKGVIKSLLSAYKAIKGTDTLSCWMYHCNFIGLILGKLAGVERIIWNIRHSNLEKKTE